MNARDIIIGVSWGVGAATCHAIVPVAVRFLSSNLPAIELLFFRNFLGLLVLLSIASWGGMGFTRTARFGDHFKRNVILFAGMWLWFASIAQLPLTKAVALHFTIPLMAVPLAILFLKEWPNRMRLIWTMIGFAGVLVILQPGAVPVGIAAIMVLASALCYAGVSIFTRSLGKTDAPSTTTFYFQSMLSIFALGPTLYVWVTPSQADIPALILLAVAGTAAPYCFIRGVVHVEVTVIGPIEYLRLPISSLLAWLIWSEPTDPWTWVGGAIIITTAYGMTRHEHRVATK